MLLLPLPHGGPRFTSPSSPHMDLDHRVDAAWVCLPHLQPGLKAGALRDRSKPRAGGRPSCHRVDGLPRVG